MLKITILVLLFVLTVTAQALYKRCPNNVKIVKCQVPPCKRVLNKVCVETFCGACKATCYNNKKHKVPCRFRGGKRHGPKGRKNRKNRKNRNNHFTKRVRNYWVD